jgi:small-conductance mechanosensitive channel
MAAVSDSVSDWFANHVSVLVTSAIIIVVAVVANFVVRRAIGHAVERFAKKSQMRREREDPQGASYGLQQETVQRMRATAVQAERSEQRARTIGSLLRYVVTITISAVAFLMVLAELGVSIAPLIAGAGIAGVALGFGAQSLVKDFLSGTFMLLEDQYGVGDVIDLGEATGTVERVTLRVTILRDINGTVWYVPNGEILRVGNKSQLWSRIVLDVEVAYDTDIAQASAVIKRVADEEWKAETPGALIIEEPEMWGVQEFAQSAIVLRLAVKTRPGEQWAAGRALRARLKTAFDEAGIEIPFPQQTVWLHGTTAGPGGATPASDVDVTAPNDAAERSPADDGVAGR